jgi:hypothetical protein
LDTPAAGWCPDPTRAPHNASGTASSGPTPSPHQPRARSRLGRDLRCPRRRKPLMTAGCRQLHGRPRRRGDPQREQPGRRANYHSLATPAGGEAIVQSAGDVFGSVDIAVNNAGILRDRSVANLPRTISTFGSRTDLAHRQALASSNQTTDSKNARALWARQVVRPRQQLVEPGARGCVRPQHLGRTAHPPRRR